MSQGVFWKIFPKVILRIPGHDSGEFMENISKIDDFKIKIEIDDFWVMTQKDFWKIFPDDFFKAFFPE